MTDLALTSSSKNIDFLKNLVDFLRHGHYDQKKRYRMKRKVKIDGMTCQHCVDTVKKAIEAIDGVELCNVRIGRASIETCLMGPEQALELEHSIINNINKAGYTIKSIK